MDCPKCGSFKTWVVNTRDTDNHKTIRRRRECLRCGHKFTTYERISDDEIKEGKLARRTIERINNILDNYNQEVKI